MRKSRSKVVKPVASATKAGVPVHKPTSSWIDVTSYARGTRGIAEPNAWEALLGEGVRVSVHRWLNLPGWFVTCRVLNVDQEQLEAAGATEAQSEALTLLRARAGEILRALRTAA